MVRFVDDEPQAEAPDERLAPVTELRPRRSGTPAPDDPPAPVTRLPTRDPGKAGRATRGAGSARGPAVSPAPAISSADTWADGEPAEPTTSTRSAQPDAEEIPLSLDEIDQIVLKRLARKPLSVWEVRKVFAEYDAPEQHVESFIGDCERRGYVDDSQLAETLIDALRRRKGQGKSAIVRELHGRHLDPTAIETAMAAIDDDDELNQALVLAEKRAGQLSSLDAATAERRLTAFLARRGYAGSVVREAVSAALADRRSAGRGPSGSSVRFR